MPVDRAKRAIAYHAIDTEREYQEIYWPEPQDIEMFITDIQVYAMKLRETLTFNNSVKLAAMRKVAALCVACFEQHGVPLREGMTPVPTLRERVETFHSRIIKAKAEGQLSFTITSAEYRDLVEAKMNLETWASPDGRHETFQSYEGLVLERLP